MNITDEMEQRITSMLAVKAHSELSEFLDIPFETVLDASAAWRNVSAALMEILEHVSDEDTRVIMTRDIGKGKEQIVRSLIAMAQRHD